MSLYRTKWREDSYGLRKTYDHIIVHFQEETFYKERKERNLAHLHERSGLLAAFSERAPAGHRDPAVDIAVVPGGQADGLDGAAVRYIVLQRQNSHIVPLHGRSHERRFKTERGTPGQIAHFKQRAGMYVLKSV
jgi:hypothetical protein